MLRGGGSPKIGTYCTASPALTNSCGEILCPRQASTEHYFNRALIQPTSGRVGALAPWLISSVGQWVAGGSCPGDIVLIHDQSCPEMPSC